MPQPKLTDGTRTVHVAETADAKPAMAKTAYDVLKARITSGKLGGDKEIDLDAVALELGTSRTPVREALLRLQSEQFVRIVPRHAVRVVAVSLADMAQMYSLVTALEVFAVELIARQSATQRDLSTLRQSIDDMRRAINLPDYAEWIDADEQFHRGLLALCHNPHISGVGLWYRDRLLRGHVIALRLRPQRSRSYSEHATLVELIEQGNVRAACNNHRAQRDRAGEELLESLARAGLTQF